MNTYSSDKKTIQLAMLLMFLSLLVIYVLLFAIKGDSLKGNAQTTTTTETITYHPEDKEQTISNILEENNTQPTMSSPSSQIDTNSFVDESPMANISAEEVDKLNEMEVLSAEFEEGLDNETEGFKSDLNINTEEKNSLDKEDDIYILSGTEKYFGPIKAIEKLGIDYAYALKDNRDIYYVYLGNHNYDFDQIARQLDGNTYKINTEQGIIENKLFGESISYINIPEYKEDTVVILATVSDITRLLQIDYAIYHESKPHLRSIFGR